MNNPYKEIILELEQGLWEHDFRVKCSKALPYDYDDETFRACIKLFMSALLKKMWDTNKATPEKAEQCGIFLREFIRDYTGIDTWTLYKKEE